MNVRHAHAGFFALLALFIAVIAGAGCTDAGKCRRGTDDGCLARPAGNGLRCDPGLSLENGVCVDNGGGDGDGDGDGDEPRDAGPYPDIECSGETLDDACAEFCEMFCYNQLRFCGKSECTQDDCEEGGLVLGICERCTNVSCANQLCQDQIDPMLNCDDFGVESVEDGERRYTTMCIESDPMCVQKAEIGCSDVCGSENKVNGEYVENGVCEDGHEMSESNACNRGTDCTDCGPHPCQQAGGGCVNHGDCCGFYGVGALCVDPDGVSAPKPPSCFPTCDDDNPCPTGFRCNPTTGAAKVCVAN